MILHVDSFKQKHFACDKTYETYRVEFESHKRRCTQLYACFSDVEKHAKSITGNDKNDCRALYNEFVGFGALHLSVHSCKNELAF